MKKDDFINQLTSELKPQVLWRPLRQTLIWLALALTAVALLMLSVQGFRPEFLQQLIDYPRLSLELIFGFSLCVFSVYYLLSSFVPGFKMSKLTVAIGAIATLGLFAMLAMSFQQASPPASFSGARAHCVEEVFIYGMIGIVSFFIITRKLDFKISASKYIFMGLGSGLVPALLMQLACMYSPTHTIALHYGPAVVLSLLLVVAKKVRRIIQ